MHSLAVMLFCTWVAFCRGEDFEQITCSIALDRTLCALPLNYSRAGACKVSVSISIKMPVNLQTHCGRALQPNMLSVMHTTSSDNAVVPMSSPNYKETYENYNESAYVHRFSFEQSAQEFLGLLSDSPSSRFFFHFVPVYSPCHGSKCDSEEVYVEQDNAPIVSFQVVNDSALELLSESDDQVTLWCPSANGSVLVNIDVQDGDVFDDDRDAFEYAAVGEPKVSTSAVVQWFESEAETDAALHVAEWSELVHIKVTSKNQVRVQLRLRMNDLSRLVNAFHLDSNRTELTYAQVKVTIDALATSGRNKLTGSGTLTVLIRLPMNSGQLGVSESTWSRFYGVIAEQNSISTVNQSNSSSASDLAGRNHSETACETGTAIAQYSEERAVQKSLENAVDAIKYKLKDVLCRGLKTTKSYKRFGCDRRNGSLARLFVFAAALELPE